MTLETNERRQREPSSACLSKLEVKGNTRCPYEGCAKGPFPKGQALKRHFIHLHATCDKPEVCVYCHEVFRRPAAYIDHQRRLHPGTDDKTKKEYTQKIVEELRRMSDDQLGKALQSAPKTTLCSKRVPIISGTANVGCSDSLGISLADSPEKPRKRQRLDARERSQPDRISPSEGGTEIVQHHERRLEHPRMTSQLAAEGTRCAETSLRKRQFPDPGQQQSFDPLPPPHSNQNAENGRRLEREHPPADSSVETSLMKRQCPDGGQQLAPSDQSAPYGAESVADRARTGRQGPGHSLSPANREPKYMFTIAPIDSLIVKVPEPLREPMRNSEIFRNATSKGYRTADCVAVLMPKDNTQDASDFNLSDRHNHESRRSAKCRPNVETRCVIFASASSVVV
ncbi:Uncharacterized protein TCAP_07251 [Tolypocladium capitatum]|uniref:C2H2-type domain-containing protein n=1 Tax=Tolypocladium capitatum TaxID=45235 RepID=A0A2K3Q182_9HYPO|nr:Uncharacterized protein TCAP_07251 [Tolypocladium capitatum]